MAALSTAALFVGQDGAETVFSGDLPYSPFFRFSKIHDLALLFNISMIPSKSAFFRCTISFDFSCKPSNIKPISSHTHA